MTLGNWLWSFFSAWIFSIINFLTKHFYARVGMGNLGLRSAMDSRSPKAGGWIGCCHEVQSI